MERIRDIIDCYFSAWGAGKAARWEQLSDGLPFSAEVALCLIQKELGLIAELPPVHEMTLSSSGLMSSS